MSRNDEIAGILCQQGFAMGLSVQFVRPFRGRHSQFLEYSLNGSDEETHIVVKEVLNWRQSAPSEVVQREFDALSQLKRKSGNDCEEKFPAPLLVLPEQNIIVLKKIVGTPLSHFIKRRGHRLANGKQRSTLTVMARKVGDWLKWFHGVTRQSPIQFRPAAYLAGLRDCLDRAMGVGLPYDVSLAIWESTRDRAARFDGRLYPAAARHGDFIPQNMMVGRTGVALVDFENFCEYDLIYDDVSAFAAYLAMMCGSPIYSPEALRGMSKEFLLAYGNDVDIEMLQLYALKAAVTIVSESSRPVGLLGIWRNFFPIWKSLGSMVASGGLAPHSATRESDPMDAKPKNRGDNTEVEIVRYSVGELDYRDVALYDERRYSGEVNLYKQRVMSNAYRRLLGLLGGKRILDVGCGTGRGVIDLASQSKLAVGCDASEDMLRFAARKSDRLLNCGFVRAYAQFLPFADNSFDIVLSLNFLHLFSIETQREMVSEMKRVVNPGGHVLLEFDNALHGFGLGLYKRWFRDERGALPKEINSIIGNDCRVVSVHGAVFPVVWRLLYRMPKISIRLEKLSYFWPMNRFAHRIYYKLRKNA